MECLDEIGYIHWHGVNGCIVMCLNISEHTPVLFSDEINSNTFTTETTTATNSETKKVED